MRLRDYPHLIQSSSFKRTEQLSFYDLFLCFRYSCSSPSLLHFLQVTKAYYLITYYIYIYTHTLFFKYYNLKKKKIELCRRGLTSSLKLPLLYRIALLSLMGYVLRLMIKAIATSSFIRYSVLFLYLPN